MRVLGLSVADEPEAGVAGGSADGSGVWGGAEITEGRTRWRGGRFEGVSLRRPGSVRLMSSFSEAVAGVFDFQGASLGRNGKSWAACTADADTQAQPRRLPHELRLQAVNEVGIGVRAADEDRH